MTYQEIITDIKKYILPGSHSGLERIKALLSLMGNPESKLNYIHVAGTNGKGSTCTMLSAIIQKAGYKTAVFSSPFLVSEKEYFRINNDLIDEMTFTNLWLITKKHLVTMKTPPSEFEVFTAMALLYYFESKCDIVIMETGMGGLLDATNVIPTPLIAVITRIGYDHLEFLGDTITEIAHHKAGIIKQGCDVISYPSNENAIEVIRAMCLSLDCPLHIISADDISVTEVSAEKSVFNYHSKRISMNDVNLSLLGTHQRLNAALVIETIFSLSNKGYTIGNEAILYGLTHSHIFARFDRLSEEPLFIADGGHNPQCIEALTESLSEIYPEKKFVILTGVMKDKDYKSMYKMLIPYAKEFITVTPDNPRSMKAENLASEILLILKDEHISLPVHVADSVQHGIDIAKSHCKSSEGILATGTLYMMGVIREYFM